MQKGFGQISFKLTSTDFSWSSINSQSLYKWFVAIDTQLLNAWYKKWKAKVATDDGIFVI